MKPRWAMTRISSGLSSSPFSTFLTYKPQPFPNLLSNTKSSDFVLNPLTISSILSTCGREGCLRHGTSIHASIIKNFEYFDPRFQPNSRNILAVWNSLVSMYSKCGELSSAVKLFDKMPMRDTISWNSIISGFLRIEEFGMGFRFFKQMHDSGSSRLDQATLTTIISACDNPARLHVVMSMHSLVLSGGYEQEISVGNALITNYFRCGCGNSARQVFDEMFAKNVITWTAVISGLAQREFSVESLKLFSEMCHDLVVPNSLTCSSSLLACSGLRALKEGRQIHGLILKSGFESDLCIESALMDMYSKCGCMGDACRIFDSAKEIDEISMTVILVGFAQNGLEEDAINIFAKMVRVGIAIDCNMVSAILGADVYLALGKQIHTLAIKKNFCSNTFVSNGLINMYSKSGDLEESVTIFNGMVQRNHVSWNSIIAAFARHGGGFEALQLYEMMKLENVEPTDVTFLSLLHACSHIGSIEQGMDFLETMAKVHGISPRMEHYACIVDMLGRAGHLNAAKNFIENLPVEPGVLVWQALLGACSIYGNSEIGKYAADNLLLAAPGSPTPYILMANIYSSQGKWEDRAKVIRKMKEMGVKKETGMSWIEIDKEVHSFVVEDRFHPQVPVIYKVLKDLLRLVKDEGYVLDKRFILYYDDKGAF